MHYLIYSSERKPSCTEQDLIDILEISNKNNPLKDITGILLHANDSFLQYLEGSKDEIHKLYEKIKLDERHTKVTLLNEGQIEERNFPDWHMVYKNTDHGRDDLEKDISEAEMKTLDLLLSGAALWKMSRLNTL